VLVAGRHRLAAAKKLDWKTIRCRIMSSGTTGLSPQEKLDAEIAGFSKATAAATGKSERDVQRAAKRGKVLGESAPRLAGTSLDKGEELDALVKMPAEQRELLMAKAVAGEQVTAQRKANGTGNLMRAWQSASVEEREAFLLEIGARLNPAAPEIEEAAAEPAVAPAPASEASDFKPAPFLTKGSSEAERRPGIALCREGIDMSTRRTGAVAPLTAMVLPFPLTRRVHFVAKTAARVADAACDRVAEKLLAVAIQQQVDALTRKGVDQALIAREASALEAAVRARVGRLVLRRGGAA
jgi:hypothetical protein